jgi:hypothetical protein
MESRPVTFPNHVHFAFLTAKLLAIVPLENLEISEWMGVIFLSGFRPIQHGSIEHPQNQMSCSHGGLNPGLPIMGREAGESLTSDVAFLLSCIRGYD